jgi:lipopolysaccharide/colanic/teichoic acid biosynthesis glycosyltransferase
MTPCPKGQPAASQLARAPLAPPCLPTRYLAFRTALDFLVALVLLVVLGPLILVLMALVKLTSPGTALYTQTRLGRGGVAYRIYKLRTMEQDCERRSGVRWSTAGDPRVTPLGRFLRRLHLDELPQLWNVLRGEMSLIGPRPERPEIIAELERALPHYRERLAVKPGITGLAQVQLPPDVDLASVERKLERDRYYIARMGLVLDLKILAATAAKVAGVPCATRCWLLGLPMAGESSRVSLATEPA